MAKIVMGYFMRDHESDLFIGEATLVQSPRKVDVAAWSCKSSGFLEPRDLSDEPFGFRPTGLEAVLHSLDALDGPRFSLEVDRFVDLMMELLSK